MRTVSGFEIEDAYIGDHRLVRERSESVESFVSRCERQAELVVRDPDYRDHVIGMAWKGRRPLQSLEMYLLSRALDEDCVQLVTDFISRLDMYLDERTDDDISVETA